MAVRCYSADDNGMRASAHAVAKVIAAHRDADDATVLHTSPTASQYIAVALLNSESEHGELSSECKAH